jgi:hypothetical protein
MLRKIAIASIVLYIIGHIIAVSASTKCLGWNCEEVTCPDGYAVRLPSGEYLPCEKFDAYVDGDQSVTISE